MNMHTKTTGAGLGFRRELLPALHQAVPSVIDFFEVAPENWAGMGGQSAYDLRVFTERYPFVCHGLSLSLGGPGPLDETLIRRTRDFMREHGMTLFTEHLSWCADDSHLYDLLPIPMTEDAVRWTVDRISRTQDLLGMRIGVENASTYIAPPGSDMGEAEFVRAVVERTCYVHVAGHYVEDDGLLVDTHGTEVIDPVWALLDAAYAGIGRSVPTCLERDFNLPALDVLAQEVAQIARRQGVLTAPVWARVA